MRPPVRPVQQAGDGASISLLSVPEQLPSPPRSSRSGAEMGESRLIELEPVSGVRGLVPGRCNGHVSFTLQSVSSAACALMERK